MTHHFRPAADTFKSDCNRTPLSPVSIRSAIAFQPGAAELYTPVRLCPDFSQTGEALCLLHALPGSPCGMKQAQLQTSPDTLPRIGQRRYALQSASNCLTAVEPKTHQQGNKHPAYRKPLVFVACHTFADGWGNNFGLSGLNSCAGIPVKADTSGTCSTPTTPTFLQRETDGCFTPIARAKALTPPATSIAISIADFIFLLIMFDCY